MTQSLGNMVACEALREGLQVGQYYMFDAALASESIDETLRVESSEDAGFSKYVRPDWHDYTNACWASNWYRFFDDDPNDARGKMKWPGRFTDALTNATEVFNYYSSGDAVFTEIDGIPDLLDDVVHWDGGFDWFWYVIPYPELSLAFENHCWQKQEVMKGMKTIAGTDSGGWGFTMFASNRFYVYEPGDGHLHVHWTSRRAWMDDQYFVRNVSDGQLTPITESELKRLYGVTDDEILLARTTHVDALVPYSTNEVVTMVADGSITNNPVFDRGAAELLNPNASLADQRLALAKHVPAISTAMGRTPGLKNKSWNFDLNSSVYKNGWGRSHEVYEDDWQHSDMKDMAYFYVYKLYDEIVNQKGNLK